MKTLGMFLALLPWLAFYAHGFATPSSRHYASHGHRSTLPLLSQPQQLQKPAARPSGNGVASWCTSCRKKTRSASASPLTRQSSPAGISTARSMGSHRDDDDPFRGSASNPTLPLLRLLLGVAGIVVALVTLYSEYTLKTTGCGLPAGPGGVVGAVEGVSYLGVVGLAGYSAFTKIKTGRGLPVGLLGAAEGLSWLAIVVGCVVLAFQIVDYGYIPNAVPVEGGLCS